MNAKLVLLLLIALAATCLQAQPVGDESPSAESDEGKGGSMRRRRAAEETINYSVRGDPYDSPESDETAEVMQSRRKRSDSSEEKVEMKRTVSDSSNSTSEEISEEVKKPMTKRAADDDSDSDSDSDSSDSREERRDKRERKRQTEEKDGKMEEEEKPKERRRRAMEEEEKKDEKEGEKPKEVTKRQTDGMMNTPAATGDVAVSSEEQNDTQTLYLIKTVTYEVGIADGGVSDNSTLVVATPSPIAEKEVVTIYYDDAANATQSTPVA